MLLLLGDHPTSIVTSQSLILLGLILNASPSFNRKFELVSGWAALKIIMPPAWDPSVHVAAFDLLLGRVYVTGKSQASGPVKIICPYILPAILTSLNYGLEKVIIGARLPPISPTNGVSADGSVYTHESYSVTSAMEVLVEELSDLHSSTSTFRQLFKSKQTTSLLLNACQSFVTNMVDLPHLKGKVDRLLEKVSNLATLLALDNAVDSQQKREVSIP